MAKEIQRRINIAARTVTVDIEDGFGVVTPHTIPLLGDKCFHCGFAIPGTKGSPDVEASITAAIAHVDEITAGVLAQLEQVANTSPEIREHVERAKAKRAK